MLSRSQVAHWTALPSRCAGHPSYRCCHSLRWWHWAALPSRCACLIFQLTFCVTKSQPRFPFSESIKNEVSVGVHMVQGIASGSERGLQGSLQRELPFPRFPFSFSSGPVHRLQAPVWSRLQCGRAVHSLGSAWKVSSVDIDVLMSHTRS